MTTMILCALVSGVQSKPSSVPILLRHVLSEYKISFEHFEQGDIVVRSPRGIRKARWPIVGPINARFDSFRKEWVVADGLSAYRFDPRTARIRKVGDATFIGTIGKQDVLIKKDGTSKTPRPELKFLRNQLKGEDEIIAISGDLSFAVVRDTVAREATHTLLSLRPPYSKLRLGKWLTDATFGNLISLDSNRLVLTDAYSYGRSFLWYIDPKKKAVRRIGSAFTFSGCFPFSSGREIVFYDQSEGSVRKEKTLSIDAITKHQSKR